jgi:hypothetical protein
LSPYFFFVSNFTAEGFFASEGAADNEGAAEGRVNGSALKSSSPEGAADAEGSADTEGAGEADAAADKKSSSRPPGPPSFLLSSFLPFSSRRRTSSTPSFVFLSDFFAAEGAAEAVNGSTLPPSAPSFGIGSFFSDFFFLGSKGATDNEGAVEGATAPTMHVDLTSPTVFSTLSDLSNVSDLSNTQPMYAFNLPAESAIEM